MEENADKVLPPSAYIREALAARGLTQTDLALITGRYPTQISGYLRKETINPEFAKELALVLGEPAEYWLQLEARYRLTQTKEPDADTKERNRFLQDYPIKDMQKRGWITKTDDFDKMTTELQKFFAVGRDATGQERSAFFKRTIKDAHLNSAEKAWLCRARHLAKLLPESRYDETRLPELLAKLKLAARSSESTPHIAGLLQRYGIKYVIIEPLPRAGIDGASFWLDENTPVIAMSLRFDNIGSYWYTLIHEVLHIQHRDGTSFDNFADDEPVDAIEQKRRKEAAEFLVPQKRLETFIKLSRPYYSNQRIIEFAKKVGAHPGIVVGQLQHRKEILYSSHHASMAKVRELATITSFTDGWGHPVPVVKYEEIA